MKISSSAIALAVILASLLSLFSCAPVMNRYTATDFDNFDTVTELVGYTASRKRFNEVWERTKELLCRYHKFYDVYNTYDGIVNLATVNLSADSGEDRVFEVGTEIYELLTFAKEIYGDCKGKVNVALGKVTHLWKDHLENNSLPDKDAVTEAGKHTDMASFDLSEDGGKYFLTVTDPSLTFDVGAIAKGYAARRAAELLKELRAEEEGFLLNLGGMVCPVGEKPGGEPFVAGIDRPTSEPTEGYLRRIYATDRTIVTSAIHLRSYEVNGVTYSHIIDPEGLAPVSGFAAVTVVSPDPAIGDLLSTALFCMTEEEGWTVLKEIEDKYGNIDVMWVYHDMKTATTENFPVDVDK